MTFEEYAAQDAVGLATLVARREVSPAELLDAALARTEAVNPAINAVVRRLDAIARETIVGGLPDGPLRGVPMLVKDDVAIAGTIRGFGSRLFADHRDEVDDELAVRMRRAGLVLFGRTNMPELAQSTSTEPALYGPARNPWKLAHSTGGSSGGAAAAVAAGIVPTAQGGDGGGSLRQPAVNCGLFALKTTRARLPSGPSWPERLGGLGTPGFVTRSVRDSAALIDATAGPEAGNPRRLSPFQRPLLQEVGRYPGRLRIGLLLTPFIEGPVLHPACEAATRDAAALLAGLGHDVEETALPIAIRRWQDAAVVLVASNLRVALQDRAAALGRALGPDDLEPGTWVRVMQGEISAPDYLRAQRTLLRVGQAVDALFDRFDLLLTPLSCIPPPRLGLLSMSASDVPTRLALGAASIAFTRVFNCSGHPAAALPWTRNQDGLPIGVQVAGRYGAEPTLIRVAAQIEAQRPWAHQRPPEAPLLNGRGATA